MVFEGVAASELQPQQGEAPSDELGWVVEGKLQLEEESEDQDTFDCCS